METKHDVLLKVEGMMCQKNCGSTVQNALESVPGVERVIVSHPEGTARVWISTKNPTFNSKLLVEMP